MISLEKSEKFKNEYDHYRKKIDSIDNLNIKGQLENLLEKLLLEVKAIDKQHFQLSMRNTLPDITEDHKSKIIETRRKIEKLLSDYEKLKQR